MSLIAWLVIGLFIVLNVACALMLLNEEERMKRAGAMGLSAIWTVALLAAIVNFVVKPLLNLF